MFDFHGLRFYHASRCAASDSFLSTANKDPSRSNNIATLWQTLVFAWLLYIHLSTKTSDLIWSNDESYILQLYFVVLAFLIAMQTRLSLQWTDGWCHKYAITDATFLSLDYIYYINNHYLRNNLKNNISASIISTNVWRCRLLLFQIYQI